MDILKKWHVIVVDKCYMCKRNVESVALLVHCDVAYVIWIAFFSRFELSWIMPRRVVDLYACWWTTGKMLFVKDGAYVPFMVFMEEKE